MSTPNNDGKLKVAFVGDINGAVASDLKGYVDLTQPGPSMQDSDAVVIDGSSAAASSTDATAMQTALGAGTPVAIVSPTQQQIDSVAQLSRAQIAGQPAVIVCTKAGGNSGSSGYMVLTLSGSQTDSQVQSESGPDETQNVSTLKSAVEWGQSLASILARMTNPSQMTSASGVAAGGDSVSQLTPPLGATYGVELLPYPLNTTWGWSDDKTAGNGIQSFSSPMNIEFHVYYVDGEGGTPYYDVIVKITGSFSPGSMLANNKNSVGFFQDSMSLNVNVQDENNQPFTSGVTTLGHSPQNVNDDSAPVEINVPMTLMVNSGGGTSPQQFTATEETTTSIPQWAVQDQTNTSGPGWNYHQVGTWDPTVDQPSNYHQWWKKIYDGTGRGGTVKDMPSLSYSSLSFEALAAWRFDGSLIEPSTRSLGVHFNGSFSQQVAFFHNPDGCIQGHHHMLYGGWTWNWGWWFDLSWVAVPTGQ